MLFRAYYSQNYAGIIRPTLPPEQCKTASGAPVDGLVGWDLGSKTQMNQPSRCGFNCTTRKQCAKHEPHGDGRACMNLIYKIIDVSVQRWSVVR